VIDASSRKASVQRKTLSKRALLAVRLATTSTMATASVTAIAATCDGPKAWNRAGIAAPLLDAQQASSAPWRIIGAKMILSRMTLSQFGSGVLSHAPRAGVVQW
jgi:hypothetical protein